MKQTATVIFLNLFVVLVFCGCSFSKPSHSSRVQISHDVIVENLSPEQSLQFKHLRKESDTSCEQHLAKVTCISESSEFGFDDKCTSKGVTQQMLGSLNQIYSELPEFHKEVLCHLERIQVHPKLMSIGYVSAVRDAERRPIGSMMGLKIEMLSGDLRSDVMSWKEQLNFGITDLKDPIRIPSPIGPFVEQKMSSKSPLLFAVVIHELNHLIDMFNNVSNSYGDCTPIEGKEFLGRCKYVEGSFPTLSWGDDVELFIDDLPEGFQYSYPRPVRSSKYPLLSQLCYYWCEGKVISASLIEKTYQQLYESPFLTPYSISSEMEDFAESAIFSIMSLTDQSAYYLIKDGQGKILYDTRIHLKNAVVQPKMKWLDEFFKRDDLRFKFSEPLK